MRKNNGDNAADFGRRQLVRTLIAGAVAGVVGILGTRISLSAAEVLNGQSSVDSAEALKKLREGNQRFVSGRLVSIHQDLASVRRQTAAAQKPFAAVLACSDSRVPVELIFDQTIGQLFVTRLAGNIITPEVVASLEYAIALLGIKVLLVLGHSNCGAVKAAMKSEDAPGRISTLYPHLQQAVDEAGGNLDQAIRANARIQADLLKSLSNVVRESVTAEKLKLEVGVYDLATGTVT